MTSGTANRPVWRGFIPRRNVRCRGGTAGDKPPPYRPTREPALPVMDRIMPPEACRQTLWRLRVGDRIRPDQLIAEWVKAGYEPVSVVEGPGEFARRGGIIDIYPLGPQRSGSAAEARHPAFR